MNRTGRNIKILIYNSFKNINPRLVCCFYAPDITIIRNENFNSYEPFCSLEQLFDEIKRGIKQ